MLEFRYGFWSFESLILITMSLVPIGLNRCLGVFPVFLVTGSDSSVGFTDFATFTLAAMRNLPLVELEPQLLISLVLTTTNLFRTCRLEFAVSVVWVPHECVLVVLAIAFELN